MHTFVLTMFVLHASVIALNLLSVALGDHGGYTALRITISTGLAAWAAWLLWGAR